MEPIAIMPIVEPLVEFLSDAQTTLLPRLFCISVIIQSNNL